MHQLFQALARKRDIQVQYETFDHGILLFCPSVADFGALVGLSKGAMESMAMQEIPGEKREPWVWKVIKCAPGEEDAILDYLEDFLGVLIGREFFTREPDALRVLFPHDLSLSGFMANFEQQVTKESKQEASHSLHLESSR